MLNSGYEGAREITKRLKNTMGWSATSGEVDNFIYEDANETFIKDPEMRERMLQVCRSCLFFYFCSGLRGYISVLLVSCFIWSGALDLQLWSSLIITCNITSITFNPY